MKLILNVGLQYNAGKSVAEHSLADVCKVVNEHGFAIYTSGVRQSVTEPTAVLYVVDRDVWHRDLRGRLTQIAEALVQDCIAAVPCINVSPVMDKGELFGPRAEAWGRFNQQYFLVR